MSHDAEHSQIESSFVAAGFYGEHCMLKTGRIVVVRYKWRKVLFLWTLCGVSCGLGLYFPPWDCLAFLQQLFDLTTLGHTRSECRP